MSQVIKPLANSFNIGSVANSCGSATLVKVINTSTAATLVFKYANNVQYAEIPVAANESVIVQKANTDLIIGTAMLASSIAWPKG